MRISRTIIVFDAEDDGHTVRGDGVPAGHRFCFCWG
jgi:hypothetical protein